MGETDGKKCVEKSINLKKNFKSRKVLFLKETHFFLSNPEQGEWLKMSVYRLLQREDRREFH